MVELRITRFWVKNFKSLRDVSIDLGMFLKIISLESKYINPFLEWWGYQNVVWRGQEELPIILGFEANIKDYKGIYEIHISGIGGEFKVLREIISIPNVVEILREGNSISVKHNPDFIDDVWDSVKDTIGLDKEQILAQEATIQIDKTELLFSSWFATYVGKVSLAVPKPPSVVSKIQHLRSHLKIISPAIPMTETDSSKIFQYVPLVVAIAPPIRQRDIVILRQLTFRAIRTPQPFKRETQLVEDASNLANVFHSLYLEKNGVPSRIRIAISTIFGESVSIKPEITEDGRVYIKVFEDGLELKPTMVADGLWKVLAIMVAIERRPKLLVIDELENSLHPEAIEYVVNELKNSGSIVIATTHSPAVVDVARPEDLILVEKDIEGNTITRRISEPDKVRVWLTKHGITLSEGWLYGEIFSRS